MFMRNHAARFGLPIHRPSPLLPHRVARVACPPH
jgi:hypothetical protein